MPEHPTPPYIKPVHHRMTRRCTFHDYNRKGTYLITVVVDEGRPSLGDLEGDPLVPHLQKNCPYVRYNMLGLTIYHDCIPAITRHYHMVKVWKVCIMPDHIHLIIRVDATLPNHRHLGHIIAGFKSGCSKAARELGLTKTELLPDGKRTLQPLFVPNYNDKILFDIHPLFERWVHYMEDNPRRLLIKQRYPQYFRVIRTMVIGPQNCQTVGNIYLLKNPEKIAVIYHRRYTDQQWTTLVKQYLEFAEQGGVLVGTGIHPKEKEVFAAAYQKEYRIIKLMGNGFPDRYKPAGKDFDYCSEGLLLQVTPFEYNPRHTHLTRPECLQLNALAESIVQGADIRIVPTPPPPSPISV